MSEKEKLLEDSKHTRKVVQDLTRFVRRAQFSGEDALEVVDCLQFLTFLRNQVETQIDQFKAELDKEKSEEKKSA